MPDWLFDPLWTGPSRAAKFLADKIDPPMGEGGRVRGFLAGALEGGGDLLSEATSPANIGLAAIPGMMARPAMQMGRMLKDSRRMLDDTRSLLRTYDRPTEELGQLYDRLGPEFVPIGGEDAFNAVRKARVASENMAIKERAKEAEERFRNFRTDRTFPIGGNDIDVAAMMAKREASRFRPSAKYIGKQEGIPGEIEDFDLYNVDWPGHELHGSTVDAATAKKLGLLR